MFTEQMDTRVFALASSHVLWLVLFGKRFLHKQFAEMVLSTNIKRPSTANCKKSCELLCLYVSLKLSTGLEKFGV